MTIDGEQADVASLLLELYRRMYLIRRFEVLARDLYRNGEIPGFIHLALGQEATAVGACYWLTEGDVITSTHRGHGHALAKGIPPEEIFAELLGRETGVCRGRGGSMHIADPARGIFGANGIVGAGIPIAEGAAFAAQYRGSQSAAVAFLGDGAVSTGAFHEAVNLAALWRSPLVLFCENNGFSEFSSFEDQQPVSLETRIKGYGINYVKVDGNDVLEVVRTMNAVLASVRSGSGPFFVEALTYRVAGHYEGDPQRYRESDAGAQVRDPLDVTRQQLADCGVEAAMIAEIQNKVDADLSAALEEARAARHPLPAELAVGMVRPRPPLPVTSSSDQIDPDSNWKMYQAIASAIVMEMEHDPTVFMAGIDVGRGGNVFGITRGLKDRWPDRVLDTPISESAIVGLAAGAAMAGLRPLVEIMYFDFIGVCFDQIINQIAKLPYMTGGAASMALTIRTQFGAGRSSGAQHSQSLEVLLAHVPGLAVVMPSTPADAYGLLRSAIRDPNPVVFVENRLQYGTRGPRCSPDHLVPIGQAAVRRAGTDVTVVSYSRIMDACLTAADLLAEQGVSCEVIDLRTIVPLDFDTVLTSVRKTSRAVIVHEAVKDFGVGAEIAARLADEAIWYLDGPVVRVCAQPTPAPYSPVLEASWLPNETHIVEAVLKTMR
jgi:2-oxoisovalerate dehydrogenase E1 component